MGNNPEKFGQPSAERALSQSLASQSSSGRLYLARACETLGSYWSLIDRSWCSGNKQWYGGETVYYKQRYHQHNAPVEKIMSKLHN